MAGTARSVSRQREVEQKADQEVARLLDGLRSLVRLSKVSNKAQHVREHLQAEVQAANVVNAVENLLGLVHDLKQHHLLHSFADITEEVRETARESNEAAEAIYARLATLRDEMSLSLEEMETHYFASPHK